MRLEQAKVWHHHKHLVVAVIEDEPSVVAAVRRLHRLGINNDQISLLALDKEKLHEAVEELGPHQGQRLHEDETCDLLGDEIRSQGRSEAAGMSIGACVGLVIGLGTFALPGIGAFLLAAGPVVQGLNVLGHMLWGGVGMGMLMGAIFDERVSEEQRDYFKTSLEQGRWLLIVHGDAPLIEQAVEEVRGERVERVTSF